MEKFLALLEEKQAAVRNAALACFARHGYEKASINDIAVAAGVFQGVRVLVLWLKTGSLRVSVPLLRPADEAGL